MKLHVFAPLSSTRYTSLVLLWCTLFNCRNYHSVILPWALAKNASENGTPITVLDHQSFFTPLWDDPGLRWIHGTLAKPSTPESSDSPVNEKDTSAGGSNVSRDSNKRHSGESNALRSRIPLPPSLEKGPGDDIGILQRGDRAPNEAGFELELTGQFAYHMWHHLLDERISLATDGLLQSAADLGPEDALRRDSSFNRVARKYLTSGILGRYYAFKFAATKVEESTSTAADARRHRVR